MNGSQSTLNKTHVHRENIEKTRARYGTVTFSFWGSSVNKLSYHAAPGWEWPPIIFLDCVRLQKLVKKFGKEFYYVWSVEICYSLTEEFRIINLPRGSITVEEWVRVIQQRISLAPPLSIELELLKDKDWTPKNQSMAIYIQQMNWCGCLGSTP